MDRPLTARTLRQADPDLVRVLFPLGASIAFAERRAPTLTARVYAAARARAAAPAVEVDRAMGCIARAARAEGYSAGARAITQAVRRAGQERRHA